MVEQASAKRAMRLNPTNIAFCIILVLAVLIRLLFLFDLARFPIMLVPLDTQMATRNADYSAFDNSALSLADQARRTLGLPAIERNHPRATYYFTLARKDEDAEALPVIEYVNGFDRVYFRPPLYIWFLGMQYFLFGDNQVAIHLAQMALGLCKALLAYALARRLCGRTAALFALAISAFYWPLIIFENLHHDNTLVGCFLLLVSYCALRWSGRRSLSAAAALGAVHGITLYGAPALKLFIPVVALWMAWAIYRNERTPALPVYRILRHVAVYGLIVCAFIMLWCARNYYVAGNFMAQPFTNHTVFELALHIFSNEDINEVQYVMGPYWDNNPAHLEITAQLDTSLDIEEMSRELGRMAMPHIWSNPMAVARHSLSSALRFWSPSERFAKDIEYEYAIRFLSPALRRLPVNFTMVFIPFVLGLSCLGCIYLLPLFTPRTNHTSGNTQHGAAGIETIVFLVLLIAVWYAPFIFISARAVYRMPLVPLLGILGAWGFAQLHTYARSRSRLGLTCAVTPAIVLLPVMLMIPVSYEEGVLTWYRTTIEHLKARDEHWTALSFARRIADGRPRDADIQFETAVLLLHEGNDDIGAFHYYVRAMNALSPSRADFIAHLANQVCRLLLRLDEDDKTATESLYDYALDHRRHERHTMIALAESFLLHDAAEKAMAFFEAAHKTGPEDAGSLLLKGLILNAQGQTEQAITTLLQGIERYPSDAALRLGLADIQAEQGNVDEACESYRKVLALDPGNEEAQRAMAGICKSP